MLCVLFVSLCSTALATTDTVLSKRVDVLERLVASQAAMIAELQLAVSLDKGSKAAEVSRLPPSGDAKVSESENFDANIVLPIKRNNSHRKLSGADVVELDLANDNSQILFGTAAKISSTSNDGSPQLSVNVGETEAIKAFDSGKVQIMNLAWPGFSQSSQKSAVKGNALMIETSWASGGYGSFCGPGDCGHRCASPINGSEWPAPHSRMLTVTTSASVLEPATLTAHFTVRRTV